MVVLASCGGGILNCFAASFLIPVAPRCRHPTNNRIIDPYIGMVLGLILLCVRIPVSVMINNAGVKKYRKSKGLISLVFIF